MNMFNRGFNGKTVGIVGGLKTGPVNLTPKPAGIVPTPTIGAAAAPAPAPAAAPAVPPGTQVKASCARPSAPPPTPGAPATPPGAIPTGSKANCPVCRTFGG